MSNAPTKNVLRRIVAWLPMYVCYYTGELAFQIIDRWPGDWSDEKTIGDRIACRLYDVYQRGMAMSCDLNDWAGFSLWYESKDGR